MEFQQVSPILWTNDLEGTTRFYREILGFSARTDFPDFVSLQKGKINIMFVTPQVPEDCPPNDEQLFHSPLLTGSLFILMTEVDEFWSITNDKVTVKTSLGDREYLMRDFSILDNNGYELVFGQDISSQKLRLNISD